MNGIVDSAKKFLERNRLMPSYAEDTVFLMALSLVTVLSIDQSARDFAVEVFGHWHYGSIVVVLGATFGIYTALFTYFKTEQQKYYMFWFAVLVNGFAALAVIGVVLHASLPFWYYAAPCFNIFIAVMMVFFWNADLVDTDILPNHPPTYSNIVYGGIAVLGTIFVSEYVLGIVWPVAFSAAVGYATLFNEKISGFLPRIFVHRDEVIDYYRLLLQRILDNADVFYQYGAFSIAVMSTDETTALIHIPEEYCKNNDTISEFLNDQVRQLPRTSRAVAMAVSGNHTSAYRPGNATVEPALIIEIYPQKEPKGYQFCQMVKIGADRSVKAYKNVTYIKRVDNPYA